MISFLQAATTFEKVKTILELGIANKVGNIKQEEARARLLFIREIYHMVHTYTELYTDPTLEKKVGNKITAFNLTKLNSYLDKYGQLNEKLISLLIATLTKFAKSACCGEAGCLSYIEILNDNSMNGYVEFLEIKTTENSDNHAFVLLNRDSGTDIQNPLSWNKNGFTIYFDIWSNKLLSAKALDLQKLAEIGEINYKNASSLSITIRDAHIGPLTTAEHQQAMELLEALFFVNQTFARQGFDLLFDRVHWKPNDREGEIRFLNQSILVAIKSHRTVLNDISFLCKSETAFSRHFYPYKLFSIQKEKEKKRQVAELNNRAFFSAEGVDQPKSLQLYFLDKELDPSKTSML